MLCFDNLKRIVSFVAS